MLTVSLKDFAGDVPHLAGATRAEQLARDVVRRVESGGTVLFDFTGIESVTSSFLKALIYPFLDDGK